MNTEDTAAGGGRIAKTFRHVAAASASAVLSLSLVAVGGYPASAAMIGSPDSSPSTASTTSSTATVTADIADSGDAGVTEDSESSDDGFSWSSLLGIDAVDAEASIGWETGSSGSGSGGWSSMYRWESAYDGMSGDMTPWEYIKKRWEHRRGLDGQYMEWSMMNPSGGAYNGYDDFINQCKRSERPDSWIWYTTDERSSGGYGYPTRNGVASWDSRQFAGSNGDWINSPVGPNPTEEEWDAFINAGGGSDWNSGDLAMVCSTPSMEEEANGPSIERGTISYTAEKTTESTDEHSMRCENAFVAAEIAPGLEVNNQRDTPVVRQAHYPAPNDSSDNPGTRECGELYQEIRNGDWDGKSWSEVQDAIQQASEDGIGDLPWDLSEQNQTALAEGNVANVDMRTRDVTIDWAQDIETTREVTSYCEYWYEENEYGSIDNVVELNCSQNGYPNNDEPSGSDHGLIDYKCDLGDWNSSNYGKKTRLNEYMGSGNCPAIRGWDSVDDSAGQSNAESTFHDFTVERFYQTIGVTCNREDFEGAVAAADGANIENVSNASRPNDPNFTGVAYSATKTGNDARQAIAERDWGRSNASDPALAATGTLEFYTKACSDPGNVCTPDGDVHFANSDSGNTNYDNFRNALESDPASGGDNSEPFGPGTGSGEKNELTFTRDNTANYLELQPTAPDASESSSLVSVGNNGLPTRTIVSRWSEGTPGITGDNGGQFRASAVDEEGNHHELFQGSSDAFTATGNGPLPTTSGNTLSILDGAINKFYVRSNWASDSDKPEILNVGWNYEMDVNTSINTGVNPAADGEDRYEGSSGNSVVEVSTTRYGDCYADFSGEENYDYEEHAHENTGEGTEYTPSQEDDNVSWNADTSSSNNLVLNFVRSVSER